jgi:hypothetical protein
MIILFSLIALFSAIGLFFTVICVYEYYTNSFKNWLEDLFTKYSKIFIILMIVGATQSCVSSKIHPADMSFNKKTINQHISLKPIKIKHCNL